MFSGSFKVVLIVALIKMSFSGEITEMTGGSSTETTNSSNGESLKIRNKTFDPSSMETVNQTQIINITEDPMIITTKKPLVSFSDQVGDAPENSSSNPIVNITEGLIRGKTMTSVRSHRTFFAFMGIPYAKPPVGDLRFQPPKPMDRWSGIRDGTEEGPPCPQLLYLTHTFLGEENCLFLNVFTPKLSTRNDSQLLPVMVWIQGGAFTTGSSSVSVYGPDYFIDEDVVLVTFNHRIGVLGFLSLQNEEVPGNNGLKDQVWALRWVRKNIIHFGGNPQKVTIFGQSSGAASVHYHLLSSMTQGLFHRAISESGSALNPWAFQSPSSALELAFNMSESLGPTTNDKKEVLERLKNVDPKWLVDYINKLKQRNGAIIGPTVDNIDGSSGVFLADFPINLIKKGKFHKVPYIIGVNDEEGILAAKILKRAKWLLLIMPVSMSFEMTLRYIFGTKVRDVHSMAKDMEKYFFNNTKPRILQYIDVVTDFYFVNGVHCAAQKHGMSSSPVFSYEFQFNGTSNFFKKFLGGEEFPGASHGDEMAYMFPMQEFNIQITTESPEYTTSLRIVKMWTNFAKTGNPTPEADSLLQNITWKPVGRHEFSYLNIDKDLKVTRNDFHSGRPDLWDELFSKYTDGVSTCWSV